MARGNSRNSQAMVKTRTKKYKLKYLKSLAMAESCVISPLPHTGDGSTFGSWLAAPRTPRGEAGVRMALITTCQGGGVVALSSTGFGDNILLSVPYTCMMAADIRGSQDKADHSHYLH